MVNSKLFSEEQLKNLAFTEEEKEQLAKAREMPFAFDEECPPTTPEKAVKFRRVNPPRNYRKPYNDEGVLSMTKVYTFQELVEMIMPILNRYHAEKASVFGSYARGEAKTESDIDLLVYGGSQFNPTDIFAITEELYIESGKKVDVYEIGELNPESDLYKNVMSEGKIIACPRK